MRVDELSIGDYVLNGGEAAALVVVEAVVRLLPGVIGNPESLPEESHSASTPACWRARSTPSRRSGEGSTVPEVLLSGHHAKIAEWRREQALTRTRRHRPELLPATSGGVGGDAGHAGGCR